MDYKNTIQTIVEAQSDEETGMSTINKIGLGLSVGSLGITAVDGGIAAKNTYKAANANAAELQQARDALNPRIERLRNEYRSYRDEITKAQKLGWNPNDTIVKNVKEYKDQSRNDLIKKRMEQRAIDIQLAKERNRGIVNKAVNLFNRLKRGGK